MKAIPLTLAGDIDVVIRAPRAEDASAIMAFDMAVQSEEHLQGMDMDEPSMNLAEREFWIASISESDDCFTLVVECEGKIVGLLESRIREHPRLNSHVLRFYLSIVKELWGKSLGTKLLEIMIKWAKSEPKIEKISLSVLSSNLRALGLYQRMGFVEDGRKKKEYQLPDGSYADEVYMAMFLEKGLG